MKGYTQTWKVWETCTLCCIVCGVLSFLVFMVNPAVTKFSTLRNWTLPIVVKQSYVTTATETRQLFISFSILLTVSLIQNVLPLYCYSECHQVMYSHKINDLHRLVPRFRFRNCSVDVTINFGILSHTRFNSEHLSVLTAKLKCKEQDLDFERDYEELYKVFSCNLINDIEFFP